MFTAGLFTCCALNVSNGVPGCRCECMCHLKPPPAAAHYVSEMHYTELCATDIYTSNLDSVNTTDSVLCHARHINETKLVALKSAAPSVQLSDEEEGAFWRTVG